MKTCFETEAQDNSEIACNLDQQFSLALGKTVTGDTSSITMNITAQLITTPVSMSDELYVGLKCPVIKDTSGMSLELSMLCKMTQILRCILIFFTFKNNKVINYTSLTIK